MEGDSPRIEEDNSQKLLEKSDDAIRINDESEIKVSKPEEQATGEVSNSAFFETNQKIKYQLKNSRFAEARETIE